MSSSAASRPPYTMSSMVIYALWCSPEKCLTLAEVCEYLEYMFGEFDHTWYRRVKTTLSKYDHFVKMKNPRTPTKNLWTVDLSLVSSTSFRRRVTSGDANNWPEFIHEYLGVPEIMLPDVAYKAASSAPSVPSSQLSFGIDRILGTPFRSSSAEVLVSPEEDSPGCDSCNSVFDSTHDMSDSLHEVSYSSMERFRGYSDVSSSQDLQDFGHSTRIDSESSLLLLDAPCSPIEPELSQDDIFAGVEELQSILEPEDVFDFLAPEEFGVVSSAESYSLSTLDSIADFVIPTQCPGDFITEFEPYLRNVID